MTEWVSIPADHNGFGPAIVGWAGSPQVMRAFHDGERWFAIAPMEDGTVRAGGACVRLAEAPTHYLPGSIEHKLWSIPGDMVVAA